MKIFAKNIFIGLLGLIIIASFFSAFVMLGDDPAVVTIDELVRKIKNGEVSRIMVNGENLNITLKDNTLLSSKKESEAGLTETLNNFGVNADMLQGVAIGIEEKSGLRFWLELLIPSLLPLIIIIAIFWLMFRQAKTGINQAFTFGQDFDFLPAFRKRESPLMMLLDSKRQRKNFGRWLIFLKIPKNILISERKFLVECSLLANQAQAKPFLLGQLQEKAECHSFIFRHLNLWKCLWELVRVGQGMRF